VDYVKVLPKPTRHGEYLVERQAALTTAKPMPDAPNLQALAPDEAGQFVKLSLLQQLLRRR
jgi:hypothetical protein